MWGDALHGGVYLIPTVWTVNSISCFCWSDVRKTDFMVRLRHCGHLPSRAKCT